MPPGPQLYPGPPRGASLPPAPLPSLGAHVLGHSWHASTPAGRCQARNRQLRSFLPPGISLVGPPPADACGSVTAAELGAEPHASRHLPRGRVLPDYFLSCPLTSPHSCFHRAVLLAVLIMTAAVACRPPSPPGSQTPPEVSVGPGAFAIGSPGTRLQSAVRCRALGPSKVPRPDESHRADNLTSFHKWGAAVEKLPCLPRGNKDSGSARAEAKPRHSPRAA
ncbi:unnamed protein product [Rangifer tarandus platyrhynchus]|uniref:Uncharacterized protein n=1 Tax=Rangifer tarandus platyrhynchus TaxID=3082113 RepID=A0AC60A7C2_RANTA